MSPKARLRHLHRRLAQFTAADELPVTVFLIEVAPGEPTGTRELGDGVREIRFDPTGERPALPDGPFKLISGALYDV